ncbi:Zinc knuckle [Musa troglodytarum]|uniref:Zinc knuckle n=1 Tax=Musa troglodytarum TaxID=320322 RepID=A0A9E7G4R1_9LILI|nr:Zinc knuckle [Musa troglodytarum]
MIQGLDATGYMINVAIIQCPVLSGNCCCLVLYRLCVPHVGFYALVQFGPVIVLAFLGYLACCIVPVILFTSVLISG